MKENRSSILSSQTSASLRTLKSNMIKINTHDVEAKKDSHSKDKNLRKESNDSTNIVLPAIHKGSQSPDHNNHNYHQTDLVEIHKGSQSPKLSDNLTEKLKRRKSKSVINH